MRKFFDELRWQLIMLAAVGVAFAFVLWLASNRMDELAGR